MAGLIDLNNTTEDDETPSFGSSSVCLELWHACAGPMISLPKKGSVVVYFPQGHLEHLHDFPLPASLNIPSHVFCRVVHVNLHAEEGSDEVYCQVLLVPESEQKLRGGEIDADGEEEDNEAVMKSTPHMFCKTLTASDTSTHGGFSVPRRAAEDCFPPLDYSLQRPSQELVAKDLHGQEWRFRHIYRGQPRRHLLTTGWSAFVNKKKLVSGDAVLFLRGDDGELRLGIRRAAQLKSGSAFSTLSSQQLNPSCLMEVVNALSTRCAFSVHYNPRVNSSEFIIPVQKFLKSLDYSYSVGMRFRMRFETEDAAERRFTGLIVGINDVNPVRWPGSKWRCLLVRWDDLETTRHNRVSPWEIEPYGSASTANNLIAAGLKRTKIGLPSAKLEFPVPNGIGTSDFGESLRFQKVLQGQEMLGVNTTFDSISAQSHQLSELRRCYPGSNCPGIAATTGNSIRIPQVSSDLSCNGIGFSESFRFQKVLQGQEILPSQPYARALSVDEACGNGRFGLFDGYQALRSKNGWSSNMNNNSSLLHPPVPSRQVSSPSSVLMFQQAVNPVSTSDYNNKINQVMKDKVHQRGSYASEVEGGTFVSTPAYEPILCGLAHEGTNSFAISKLHNQLDSSCSHDSISVLRGSQELVSSCKSSCRVFGFSLTEGAPVANKEADASPVACQLNSGASFTRHVEDDFHPGHSLRNKAVGSYCTKGVLQY
ncbi:auxin response factor 3-like isoform X2 [Abrus precatorius]|uniref:Auxin response factor n=1 Tax=Abrus precatorius TaxID=3816 RepID=A0A8B8KSI2_ABRPR|nr:auxin response factor 3-like isoform X2 [Abrus precatorius]